MTVRRSLGFLSVLPLYFAMAVALGYVDQRIRPNAELAYTKHIPAVLSGEADPPGRYRVLSPILEDWLTRSTGSQPENGWMVFRLLCLVVAFAAGHLLYRTWFSTGAAVAGNAIVAALLPLTFTNSWGLPEQFMELALFALGCACAVRRWRAWFLVVVALATLNRETAFLLVVVYAGLEGTSSTALRRIAVAGAVFAVVYLGLRWKFGYAEYELFQWRANLKWLFEWPVMAWRDGLYARVFGWFFVVLLVGPLIVIARTWQTQPRFVRVGAGIAVPLFVAICLMFSSVLESRIFTPLLPILATGMLFAFVDRDATPGTRL